MAHDVFVSYSTNDAGAADDIVSAVEAAGIPCWIAARDIAPGATSWAGEIERAIRQARAMILVVSPDFNESVQTPKEIILGIDERIFILPVRIAEFQPWSHLRYFLADRQWIDAAGGRLPQRLGLIVRVLQHTLQQGPVAATDVRIRREEHLDGLQPAKALGVLPFGAYLKLEMWQPMRLRDDQPSLWLQAYNALVPMSGRDHEIDDLFQMLRGAGRFRWWVYFGEAGMGKTRLALEFARRATSEGWQSGFLSSSNLRQFVSSDSLGTWRPYVPTLIIVDYAASKVTDLRVLLEHLAALEAEVQADANGPQVSPVRLLLLERHVDETRGWLEELLSAGESATGDLLRNVCYMGITQLQPPGGTAGARADGVNSTKQIIENTFGRWGVITGRTPPVLPDFTEKDWRSIKLRTGNRPLYLQMAALHACERGSAVQLPAWGRGELLRAAVAREREYVRRECSGNTDLCKALEHVTAILCLAGAGAARGRKWLRVIEEELKSIGVTSISPNKVEHHRRAIFTAAASESGEAETGVIQPDIVSEGFAAQVLRTEEGGLPAEALKQVLLLSGIKAWANMVRMVQDLLGIEKHLFGPEPTESIDTWLSPLLTERPIEELRQLVHVIPERSMSLHCFALEVAEQLLTRIPESSIAERAECMLRIGIHRCRSPHATRESLEQAIRDLQAAIRLYGTLPLDDGPCVLRRDVAKAYRLLGNAFSNLGKPEEAAKHTWIAARLSAGEPRDCAVLPAHVSDLRIDQLRTPSELELKAEFAKCLNCLSIDLSSLKQGPAAQAAATRAVELGDDLISHSWPHYAADLGRYLNNLSQAQAGSGDTAGAVLSSRRSAQIRAEFARENPDEYAYPLSLTLSTLVSLEYAQKNVTGAQAASEQLLAVYDDLSSRDPAGYRAELAQCFHNIGYLCDQSNNSEEGIRYTLEGLAIREELLESDFDQHALNLAWSHNNVGSMYRDHGAFQKAGPHLERGYALRVKWVERGAGRVLPEVAASANLMAKLCREKGDPEGELRWLNRVLSHMAAGPDSSGTSGMSVHDLAVAFGRLGRTAEAGRAASQATDQLKQAFDACRREVDVPSWLNAGCNLASAMAMQGDWTADVAVLSETIELCQNLLSQFGPEDSGLTFTWGAIMNNLGHAQFRRGELSGSVPGIREGLETLRIGTEHHRKHGNVAAAAETNEIAERAEAALGKWPTESGGAVISVAT